MKTILISAYAVNPYKGSEDGMGWNFILQAARYQKIIAVTRKNNLPHIKRYQKEFPEDNELYSKIEFHGVDWPLWLIKWKKGPLLSLIYYYFWQITVAIKMMPFKRKVDIVHNLNFHNDWTPSFLWLMGKPFVWGPIGHHPSIPKEYRKRLSYKERLVDGMLGFTKKMFWQFDPFLFMTKKNADHIFCMNSVAAQKINLAHKVSIMPSVATNEVVIKPKENDDFTILSAGRFISLKGFDITIRSYAKFYNTLNEDEKKKTQLILVGSGPLENKLKYIIEEEGIAQSTKIINWIPHTEMKNIYEKASAFLFPSYEGAGMVVAEAMSYGLPVVCWKNAGPGEFVHPNSATSINYTEYDLAIKEFSQIIYRLFSDSNFRSEEKMKVLYQYREKFNWSLRGESLQEVYQKIIA